MNCPIPSLSLILRSALARFIAIQSWVGVAATLMFVAETNPANAASQEVVFRVGTQSAVDWFVIDDPSIHGTLNVTNTTYGSVPLNAAAVDLSRNRLIYDTLGATTPEGWAISLAGLQLIPNGVTTVAATDLGAWPDGSADAGYRKSDGQIYYHVDDSDELRQLNFDSTGQIAGFTKVGNLNGTNLPNSISRGDIDFSNNGSIWLTGNNDNGDPTLWNFDFSTLNTISTINLTTVYNGMTFNAAGDTLYGYQAATGKYGTINMTTGALTVLDTDQTFFGSNGDLATGTATVTIAMPEPASFFLCAASLLGLAPLARRKFMRRRVTMQSS
jgi:hypothetical protein